MLLAGVAGLVQDLVRLLCGQPLIPQMNRQARQLAQFRRKGLGLGSLRAWLAGKMQRIAHYNTHDPKAPRQPCQRAQIFALVVPSDKRQDRLRGQPQLIGDGNADAAIADIEAQIARMEGSFQLSAPDLQLAA